MLEERGGRKRTRGWRPATAGVRAAAAGRPGVRTVGS